MNRTGVRDTEVRHRCLFFFNDTATAEIYTLSLHDALPIFLAFVLVFVTAPAEAQTQDETIRVSSDEVLLDAVVRDKRSEEHTSELQSRQYLVCRLLLEKKKNYTSRHIYVISFNQSRITYII